MLAIFDSLNSHNFPIFQPILMMLVVSKFMVHRALFDKTYLLIGLLSPLKIAQNHSFVALQIYSKTISHLLKSCLIPAIHSTLES